MCHFQVRNLEDNIHDYIVQCALPINLLNEKIFIIIWFWYLYVAVASIFGVLL
jgi:innexin